MIETLLLPGFDVAVAPGSMDENAACPQLDALANWITQGKEVQFAMDMTVCAMNTIWLDLWDRGRAVSVKMDAFADRLEQRRTVAQSPVEKRRLRAMAERARELGGSAEAMPQIFFSEAQFQLSEHLSLDAGDESDFHDMFWMDIGERPGIEQTWELTLQQVYDHLKTHYVSPCNEAT